MNEERHLARKADPDKWMLYTNDYDEELMAQRREEYLAKRHNPQEELARKIRKVRLSCNKCWNCYYFKEEVGHCSHCKWIKDKL